MDIKGENDQKHWVNLCCDAGQSVTGSVCFLNEQHILLKLFSDATFYREFAKKELALGVILIDLKKVNTRL